MPRRSVTSKAKENEADTVAFEPETPGDWTDDPHDAGTALDELGARTGAGTPSGTVTDETTWAISPTAGTASAYSRGDHTHGTPAEPGGHEIFDDVTKQTLIASSTITVTDGEPYTPIDSASSITLTSQPHIAAGRDGQLVLLKNVGSYNIIVQDVNALGGCLFRLTANSVTIQPGGTLALIYDSVIGFWIQQYILNPQTFTPSIATFTCDLSTTQEVANSGTHAATFTMTLTYVGTPSACSIDISTDDAGGNWSIDVPSPYTSLSPSTTPPCAVFDKGTSVLATRQFTATATVAGTGGLTKTLTFTYYNRRYMGPSTDTDGLTTGQVLALDGAGGTSGLSDSITGTFTGITTGAGEYVWYAYREALDAAIYFAVTTATGDEVAAFTKIQDGTLSHTNDSGFVENFTTWKSDVANIGSSKTVIVSSSLGNNRIYIGPATDTNPISNASILALDDTADGESIVSNTVIRTYTAIKIEAGEYLWLVYPDRLTDPIHVKDVTTMLDIDGSWQDNVTHTNQYGYAETYRCWRSTNTGIFPTAHDVQVTM